MYPSFFLRFPALKHHVSSLRALEMLHPCMTATRGTSAASTVSSCGFPSGRQLPQPYTGAAILTERLGGGGGGGGVAGVAGLSRRLSAARGGGLCSTPTREPMQPGDVSVVSRPRSR